MLLGDDSILECIKSDSTCTNVGNLYKTSNGLQAYAWANHSVQSITAKCASIPADESINTVLICCGDVGNPTAEDYNNLITQVQSKFPSAKIAVHLCDNSKANDAIALLSGVDVINLRAEVYTSEDSELSEESASNWRNKIISHYTGSSTEVRSTVTNGTISIEMDATTTSKESTSYSYSGTESATTVNGDDSTSMSTSSQSGTGTSTGTSTSKSSSEGEGELEAESTSTTTQYGMFNPMVTVVHSLNAKFASEDNNVYYVPTLDELPLDMQAFIESGAYDSSYMYHGFAAAYMGMYDIEAKTQQYSNDTVYYNTTPMVYKGVNATRALEVMGYDLMLADEECNIWVDKGKVKAKYNAVEAEESGVPLDTVVMDIYKALGQSCYQYNYAFLPDSTLNPETSPLQKDISQMLGDNGTRWDTSEGACYVFTTRSNPDLYWHRAETDRIFTTVQDLYGTYQLVTQSDVPTLAEYCQLLAGMMQTYGEPVMTKEEETLLLQVYGANMPTYISDESQLDAIKYLIAKGIFNFTEKADYKWASPLTREDLWSTLMAVYDTDSRATFKDVQITTDASLVEAGYYPVGIEGSSPIVSGMSYVPVTNAESYYDYIIECKYLEADPALGCTINGVQPGETAEDPAVTLRQGVSANVKYSGLVSAGGRRFYHFKVSNKVQGGFEIALTNQVKIAIPEHIGGVYLDTAYVDDTSYGNPALLQFDADNLTIKFEDAVAKYWADATRASQSHLTDPTTGAVTNVEGEGVNAFVSLADTDSIPVLMEINAKIVKEKLSTCSINGVKLDAKLLDSDGGVQICGDATITRLGTSKGDKVTFQIEGFETYEEFRDNVDFQNVSTTTYPGYRRDSRSLLVPLKYLEVMGIVQDAKQDTSHIRLMTANNTIYIDNDKKYIINGTGVYQAPQDATLYLVDKEGVAYVDYRAALGWSAQYLDISNVQEGSVALTYKEKATDKIASKTVYDMADTIMNTHSGQTIDSVKVDGTNYLLLNSLYPTANYFVYYSNEDADGVSRDTLIVVKPKWSYNNGTSVVDNDYDDSAMRDYVNSYTGMSVASNNVLVYVYRLDRKNKVNPPGITYEEDFGYLFSPPIWNDTSIASYFKPAINADDPTSPATSFDEDIIPLPFITHGTNWYSINFNTFTSGGNGLPYGYIPERYLAKGDKSSMKVCEYTGNNWLVDLNAAEMKSDKISMTQTYSGVQSTLSSVVPQYDYKEVWGDASTAFYAGALRMTPEESQLTCGDIAVAVNSKDKFTLLRQTISGRQVAIGRDKVMVYNPSSNVELEEFTEDDGVTLNQFDWLSYAVQQTLDDTDNFLTKVTVFVIQVIPRIVVYICILLIALSLVTNVKPWVLFCDKFIDIYSVLTFGRHNVHTIDMRGIFFSSMVGIGIFWLFLDGSVFQLFGWLARAVVGIATR